MRVKLKYVLLLALMLLLIVTLVYNYAFLNQQNSDELNRHERLLLAHVTRDPNRVMHYNYPTSNNASINTDPINIAAEMPPWKEVDDHIVVVTGFNQKKAYVGLGMIASVQSHMPNKKIIVYNLGVHPKIAKQMQQMCNVEVRSFNFTNYPKHVSTLDNMAWKIYALRDVLKEYGAFFYASPQLRFRAPINFLIPYLAKHEGIVATANSHNLSADVTHPDLFVTMRTTVERFTKAHPNAYIASEHMWLAVNSSVTETKIWEPLMECAGNWRCIGPYGSKWKDVAIANGTNEHTHRYATSALNLLLYRHYYHEWCTDPELNLMLKRVFDVVQHLDLSDYLWAHYCNPPKKEIDCSIDKRKC